MGLASFLQENLATLPTGKRRRIERSKRQNDRSWKRGRISFLLLLFSLSLDLKGGRERLWPQHTGYTTMYRMKNFVVVVLPQDATTEPTQPRGKGKVDPSTKCTHTHTHTQASGGVGAPLRCTAAVINASSLFSSSLLLILLFLSTKWRNFGGGCVFGPCFEERETSSFLLLAGSHSLEMKKCPFSPLLSLPPRPLFPN